MSDPIAKHEDVIYSKYELIRVVNHTTETGIEEKHALANHWHEELEITYDLLGGALYYVDGQRIRSEAGRLIVINSESVHSIVPDGSVPEGILHGVTVLLHPKFLEENFPKYREFLFANDKRKTRSEIGDIMMKLSECARSEEIRPYEYPFYVKGLLLQLLYYMQEEGMIRRDEALSARQSRNVANLKRIMAYVEAHYREPIYQAQVAREFYFTQQYFSRYFKKHTGVTFTEYLTHYRVRQAKKCLLSGDRRIVDIAAANGFSDERSFILAFKKFYGETPFQYRKKLTQ